MRAHCAAVAAMAALAAPAAALVGSAAIEGRVLAPGSDGEGWWDQRTSAMPIVLPPSAHRKRWRMFYYGREDGNWNGGRPAFLPTGVSGLAESDDGLRWTRVRGPLEGGAVLRPPDDPAAFDHVHLGMTDVVEDAKDGSYTALFFGALPPSPVRSTMPIAAIPPPPPTPSRRHPAAIPPLPSRHHRRHPSAIPPPSRRRRRNQSPPPPP